ncbi:DUF2004 domain-containing protein [Myroides sp. M-43]|uniref:DUF2004 domain-containing protein n=1 Tax=Myroides oncorhynchi TaxID=2893756 RepID=UPI001E344AAD|nr:DUF2004 domain-containing protein [Myroides oncorhynchi]MCC9041557.1 DUF2004 domain-containing protein [Myroides oncorhynchi]
MKEKIVYTVVIVAVLIGIFMLRKPSPARIDLIPVNEQGAEYTDEPSIDDMKKIIVDTDTIYAVVNTERFNIDEKTFSKNIAIYNRQNIEAIRKDYSNPTSIVKENIDFFINNTNAEQLKKVGIDKPASKNIDKVINNLKLILIDVQAQDGYPEKYYINYFYDINGIDMGDIHLSVSTDENGNNIDIGWET